MRLVVINIEMAFRCDVATDSMANSGCSTTSVMHFISNFRFSFFFFLLSFYFDSCLSYVSSFLFSRHMRIASTNTKTESG